MSEQPKDFWVHEFKEKVSSYLSEENYKVPTPKGTYTIKIEYDRDTGDPRIENDNFSHMLFTRKSGHFGDTKLWDELGIDNADYDNWNEIREVLVEKVKPAIIFQVSMTSHSGETIYIGAPRDPWDSGTVGFIYVTYKDIRESFGIKDDVSLNQEQVEHAAKMIRSEIEEYDDWIQGNCYGYLVFGPDDPDKELDSCWGYIGSDTKRSSIIDDALAVVINHVDDND